MALLLLVLGYLLGSIPTGWILTRLLRGQDLRSVGSGATGATNSRRALGTRWGIVVMIVDVAKGLIALEIARSADASAGVLALVGVTVIIGHCWPIWLGFKGGKGIASGFGSAVGLSAYMLILAPILVVVVWRWRYVSLGSIVAAAVTGPILLVLAVLDLAPWSYLIFGIFGAPLVLWRHRANIGRIRAGTEPKLRASV